MLTPLGPLRDLSDTLLEPIQCLWRNDALELWTGRKAEPEELSLLRSRHRTLGALLRRSRTLRGKVGEHVLIRLFIESLFAAGATEIE
jgi:hypothetical protein